VRVAGISESSVGHKSEDEEGFNSGNLRWDF
jgi:hypothetical protein